MSAYSARRLVAVLYCLSAVAGTVPAAAAAPNNNASAFAAILHPINVIKTADLDFGYVAAGATAGTVVIDPETNTTAAAGGALLLGGSPHAAGFTGASGSSSVVNIKIPK